jgi:hypothetical protein
VAAGSPPAVARIDPAGSLAILGAEFETAWSAERAALADDDFPYDAFEEISGHSCRVVREIIATRATSLADFRVKARALLWCYSGDYAETLRAIFAPGTDAIPVGRPGETLDVRLLRSIVEDLLAQDADRVLAASQAEEGA